MILDEEPIADLLTVAIDGEGLAVEGIQNHQRDELFRKVVGAVVIRAIRREGREAVGVVKRADEVIARGLRGGVGAVRREGRGLGKCGIVRPERAVNLVGRDMQKTKPSAAFVGERFPIMARGIQQAQRAGDIRLHERFGRVDRAVHMRLGGEIQNGVDLMLGEQLGNQTLVANVSLLKNIARVGGEIGQVGWIPRIGEQVEVDDFLKRRACFRKPLPDKIAANEPAAASDENVHASPVPPLILLIDVFAFGQHLVEFVLELIEAGAWDDDGIATPVGRLGDLQETPALVLAQLNGEVLALNGELTGCDRIFHRNLGRANK